MQSVDENEACKENCEFEYVEKYPKSWHMLLLFEWIQKF